MLDGLVVCTKSGMGGRVMMATRPFSVGDLLFTEEPLACSTEDPLQSISAFKALTEEQQTSFLDCHSEVREPFLSAAHHLGFGELEARVLSIWDLNAYTNASGRGLYPLIAKIPHGCAPNVKVQVRDGRGEVFAACQIEINEVVCSWYSERMELLWCSSALRRHCLKEERGFDCGCVRCARPDRLRAFECNSCGGRVLQATALEESQGHDTWRCVACSVEVAADTLPLDVEADASQNVLKILEIAEEERSRALDIDSLLEFRESAAESLGDHHWIPAYLNYTLHWCYFEHRDKYSAFIHGLEYLDWFRDIGLNAPGYLLRRVFLLSSHCFQHVRQQAKKARSPGRWQALMTHLARVALVATDGECWASNPKMLAVSAEMTEVASREPDRGGAGLGVVEEAGLDNKKLSLMARFKEAIQAQSIIIEADLKRPRDCGGETLKRPRNQ